MRVTFTTFDAPDFVGGPNSWLRRVVPALQAEGWRVEVLFTIENGAPESCPCFRALTSMGVRCRAIGSHESMFVQTRWMLQELAAAPPAAFVVNLSSAGYLATRWVRRSGVPGIGILHSDDAYYEKILAEFVAGPAGSCVSDLVCVSEYLAQRAEGVETRTAIHRIPYGVPIPEPAARLLQPPRPGVRLLYAGRLVDEQKKILDVTRALCRAVREVPGVEAVLYGDGPDRARVEGLLRDEGLGARVRLGGAIDNARIQEAMGEADVFVLLSDYEGLPIALLEAMACGLVPVCLRVRSGVDELIEPGRTGMLVDDRGDDFVAAVRALAASPELRARISVAARERVASRFSMEENGRRWVGLLGERARQAPEPAAVSAALERGIRTLEFLERTVSASNARAGGAR